MIDILGADRAIAVCREMTKLYEEIWRGTLAEARQEWMQRDPQGEFTLVVAGAAPEPGWDQSMVEDALAEALAAGTSVKDAVRAVTKRSGWPKRDVYSLAQAVKKG
jgi:16S rRNA (cytidine1402-2'-O)-methyltransferase